MLYNEAFSPAFCASLVGVCAAAVSVVVTAAQHFKTRSRTDSSLHGVDDIIHSTAANLPAGCKLPRTSDAGSGGGCSIILNMAAQPLVHDGHPDRTSTGNPRLLPSTSTTHSLKGVDMSWLSTIKDNLIAAVTNASPAPEQVAVHQAATNVATTIGSALTVLEQAAEVGLNELVTAKLGPVAGALEYDFLIMIEKALTTRKAKITQVAPTPVAPAAS